MKIRCIWHHQLVCTSYINIYYERSFLYDLVILVHATYTITLQIPYIFTRQVCFKSDLRSLNTIYKETNLESIENVFSLMEFCRSISSNMCWIGILSQTSGLWHFITQYYYTDLKPWQLHFFLSNHPTPLTLRKIRNQFSHMFLYKQEKC